MPIRNVMTHCSKLISHVFFITLPHWDISHFYFFSFCKCWHLTEVFKDGWLSVHPFISTWSLDPTMTHQQEVLLELAQYHLFLHLPLRHPQENEVGGWNCPWRVGGHSKVPDHSKPPLQGSVVAQNHFTQPLNMKKNDVFKYPLKLQQQYFLPSTFKTYLWLWKPWMNLKVYFSCKTNKQKNKTLKIKQSRIAWTTVSTCVYI